MRAQHIALAGPTQLHLDGFHAIDRVGRDPVERNARGKSARDHLHRNSSPLHRSSIASTETPVMALS